MSEYKIVYKGGTGEIVEKKSRFIANVFKVESEDEALEIIEQTRKKYWDARHNCFAYIIGENGYRHYSQLFRNMCYARMENM